MKKFIDVFSGIEYSQLFPLCKKAGFDGFFSGEIYANEPSKLDEISTIARMNSLIWETSHSTIPGSRSIWAQGEEGDRYCEVLLANTENCIRLGIPMLVVHISPDFSKNPSLELGIRRLQPIVEYATKAGVKVAFENINSPEYLYGTLQHFDDPHVGFCYDSGHEACHTPGERFLPKIGNRLFCTHLHDNDGKGDRHWLPFDGSIDFERISYDLKNSGYRGNLTMELYYNDKYKKLYTEEEFVQEAYLRVERLNAMIKEK